MIEKFNVVHKYYRGHVTGCITVASAILKLLKSINLEATSLINDNCKVVTPMTNHKGPD